jgi:hypothetical protein
MKFLLSSIIVLCLLDAIFTILWLSTGLAIESNPFMGLLIDESHLLFVVVKMALTYMSVFILYKYRYIRKVLITSKILAILYLIIIIYHLSGYILFR